MSVPRPALLVAMVTEPFFPGWATLSASRSWYLAFCTTCFTPFFLRAIDDVRVFLAQQVAVGRDHHHFQFVDLVELGGFGLRGAGHARQLLVHAEVVLESNGGQRLRLTLHFHFFLGFNGLVQ